MNNNTSRNCTSAATLLVALLTTAATLNAHAQETIIDNTGAAYTSTGTWKNSTAVSGYYGANYHTRLPGPSPDALVVDNTSAGFSTLGTWKSSTAISGYVGSNYQHHFANGEPPAALVVDNTQGTPTGTWNNSTSVAGYYAANYQFAAAGTGAKQFSWALPVTASGNVAFRHNTEFMDLSEVRVIGGDFRTNFANMTAHVGKMIVAPRR